MTKPITARQSEVLALVVEGRTNKEIARVIGTSSHAVNLLVGRLFENTCARNRVQLAVMAVREGLVK